MHNLSIVKVFLHRILISLFLNALGPRDDTSNIVIAFRSKVRYKNFLVITLKSVCSVWAQKCPFYLIDDDCCCTKHVIFVIVVVVVHLLLKHYSVNDKIDEGILQMKCSDDR
jgi:hypothetical protein